MPDQEQPALDPDDLALIRHLFAKATALTEDAHEIAVEGQRPNLDQAQAANAACELSASAYKVVSIEGAQAILIYPAALSRRLTICR